MSRYIPSLPKRKANASSKSGKGKKGDSRNHQTMALAAQPEDRQTPMKRSRQETTDFLPYSTSPRLVSPSSTVSFSTKEPAAMLTDVRNTEEEPPLLLDLALDMEVGPHMEAGQNTKARPSLQDEPLLEAKSRTLYEKEEPSLPFRRD